MIKEVKSVYRKVNDFLFTFFEFGGRGLVVAIITNKVMF